MSSCGARERQLPNTRRQVDAENQGIGRDAKATSTPLLLLPAHALRYRREAHAEAFNYDLDRITRDFQRQERESAREVVTRAPRKPQTVQGR